MMKKILTLTLSILLLSSSVSFAKEMGVISASSSVSKTYMPEIAVVTVAVETKDKNANKSSEKNKEISSKLIKALKSKFIKDTTIETKYYSVQPIYVYLNKKRTLEYYKTTHDIKIETTKIDLPGNIIDTAMQNGANKVQGVSFKLKDTKQKCRTLLKQASVAVKLEASDIISALGSKISGLKKINYSCSPNSYNILRYKASSYLAGSPKEGSSTEIENPNIKLNARVNADFYVED